MFHSSAVPTSLKIETSETIWLDPSEPLACFPKRVGDPLSEQSDTSEVQQWKQYLNQLAIAGFEQWLQPRVPSHWIDTTQCLNQPEAVYHFRLNGFTLSLIVKEHVLDESVEIPAVAVRKLSLFAHFYVLIEVCEEHQSVIVRGFLNHQALLDRSDQQQISQQDSCYTMPLCDFDFEPNHLVLYCDFLEPTAVRSRTSIAVPNESQPVAEIDRIPYAQLGQWLEGIFSAGWESVEDIAVAFVGAERRLAMGLRSEDNSAEASAKRCKLFDLGMDVEGQSVALLVNVVHAAESKLSVLVQLHPSGEAQYLPAGIVLTLLSHDDMKLQEVHARAQDNYIQLKPFKGRPGISFSITISLGEVCLREEFEL